MSDGAGYSIASRSPSTKLFRSLYILAPQLTTELPFLLHACDVIGDEIAHEVQSLLSQKPPMFHGQWAILVTTCNITSYSYYALNSRLIIAQLNYSYSSKFTIPQFLTLYH